MLRSWQLAGLEHRTYGPIGVIRRDGRVGKEERRDPSLRFGMTEEKFIVLNRKELDVKKARWVERAFFVEMAGVEPASKTLLDKATTLISGV